jgi:hypothetical protein
VIDVETEAEYRGSVYERTVSIGIASDVNDCFEGNDYVTSDECGTLVDVILLGQSTTLEVIDQTLDLRIDQPDEPDDDRSKWRCTLYGEIWAVFRRRNLRS